MMLGNPTVHVPPWHHPMGDQTADDLSPRPLAGGGDYSPLYLQEALTALQHYFPTSNLDSEAARDNDLPYSPARDADAPVDAYSCDHFRMFEFKIRRCARGRSHDWTECPYAHPGEKARRRDPRKYHYSGAACSEFRKGGCKKGDACEYAHGVFECWLHPARYRTQACKDALNCQRRVCFFAHSPEQLRVLPNSGDPKTVPFLTSSPAAESPAESPPMSPVNEMVVSLRNLQLGKVKSLPSAWSVQVGSPVFGSPRIRPGFCSLPNTPTQTFTRRVNPDIWEEEPAMERVESGRDLRVRMFEKLSKENQLERGDPEPNGPDLGWVSELVK